MFKQTYSIRSQTERLARQLFMVLTVLFALFIMLATLIPGHNSESYSKQSTLAKNLQFSKALFRAHDLRDVATNILLYVPLGIFLASAISSVRSSFISPWLILGFAVSFIIECIQYFIGRYADPLDVITNTSGFIFGFWIIVFAIRFIGLKPSVLLGLNERDATDSKLKTIAAFRFLYIAVYVLVALLPFDISVSVATIYDKLVPGYDGKVYILLNPLYDFQHWNKMGTRVVVEFLGLLPVAFLTSFLNGFNRRLNLFSSMLICVVLAFFTEGIQLFVVSRISDIFSIFLAAMAGIVGYFMVKFWFQLQDAHNPSTLEPFENRQKLIKMMILSYALVICFVAWAPYEFEYQPKDVLRKIIKESNLLPFKQHFSVRNIWSALDIVKESGVFIPLGVLLTFYFSYYCRSDSRLKTMIKVVGACVLFALFVEFSQAACVGRTVDVTDILLAAIGGFVGSGLFRLFSKNQR